MHLHLLQQRLKQDTTNTTPTEEQPSSTAPRSEEQPADTGTEKVIRGEPARNLRPRKDLKVPDRFQDFVAK